MRCGSAVGAAVIVAGLAGSTQLTLGQATSQSTKRAVRSARPAHVEAGLRNAAEERFVRKLANEFSRTLAIVAANPDASYPRGSLADRIRSAYMRVQPSLPPRPPTRGVWTYHVRIKPFSQGQAVARGARPDRSIGPLGKPKPAPAGPAKDPDGVGPWSAPVVIHYGGSTPPPTEFHDVYRRVQFHLDSITLIEDQFGPGDEEFHILGFVQSHSPSGNGGQYGLNFTATLGDVGQEHLFGHSIRFDLPSAGDFPRVYTVLLSILEEDEGGLIEGWQTAIAEAARDALSEEVDAIFREQLQEFRDRVAAEASAKATEAAINVMKEATTNDFLSAWVNMILTLIIDAAEAGSYDDFYGTKVVTFLMPTNRVDIVRNTFGFIAMHQHSPTEWLTGALQKDGAFAIRPKYVRFRGATTYPEAGSFDGIVDIKMHWTFSGRGL